MAETKENLENMIKQLEAKSLQIEKLIDKGGDVLCFQFGSHTIKYGFANQTVPDKLRNLICYRYKQDPSLINKKIIADLTDEEYKAFDEEATNTEITLKKKGNVKVESKAYKGKLKAKIFVDIKDQTLDEIYSEHTNSIEEESSEQKEEIKDEKDCVYDKELFFHEQDSKYFVSKPFRFGIPNFENYETPSQFTNDIFNLVYYIVKTKLKIPQKDIENYSVLVVIPEAFIKPAIKGIVNVILKDIGFSKVYLHLEPIVACYGATVTTATVVDLGAEKINVCCVDEGQVLPNTSFTKYFGGTDLDHALLRMLNQRHSITTNITGFKLDAKYYGDLNQMELFKMQVSSFVQKDLELNKMYECKVCRQGKLERFYVNQNESFFVIPSFLFYSNPLNVLPARGNIDNPDLYNPKSAIYENWQDNEDYLEEFQLPITMLYQTAYQGMPGEEQKLQMFFDFKLKRQNRQPQQADDSNLKIKIQTNSFSELKICLQQTQPVQFDQQQQEKAKQILDSVGEKINNPFEMQNLDDMICYSISQVKDLELRKKMANNILLIGGLAQLKGFADELEDKLINKFSVIDGLIERVEVLDYSSKDVNPIDVSWCGATIIAKLESIKDLWITKSSWLGLIDNSDEEIEEQMGFRQVRTKDVGVKALKERLPFAW